MKTITDYITEAKEKGDWFIACIQDNNEPWTYGYAVDRLPKFKITGAPDFGKQVWFATQKDAEQKAHEWNLALKKCHSQYKDYLYNHLYVMNKNDVGVKTIAGTNTNQRGASDDLADNTNVFKYAITDKKAVHIMD